MSIRVKLLMSFAAVLCLTVCLALQALWTVKITGDLVERVYDEPLLAISQARSAAAAFQAARADIFNGSWQRGNPEYQARLQAVTDDLKADLAVVAERAKSPAVQTQLASATQAVDAWHKATVATYVEAPAGQAAIPTPQAIERLSASVASNLDDLAEQVAARGYQMRSEADATIRTSHAALLAVVILAACLGAALAFMTARGIVKPLGALSAAMRGLASGDREIGVPGLTRHDEFAPMATAVQLFKEEAIAKRQLEVEAAQAHERTERRLHEIEAAHRAATEAQALVLKVLGEALERLARRDLLTKVDVPVPAEYQKLKDDFNAALEQLKQAIQNVSLSTQAIQSKTQRVASSSDDLSRRTEQQAASLEEAAATLGEITDTIKKTAEGASHANKVASDASSGAETGRDVVRQAIAAMAGIEKSSQKIGQIISVIDEIAFQTNLLALNAGVEAARAGDAGRGLRSWPPKCARSPSAPPMRRGRSRASSSPQKPKSTRASILSSAPARSSNASSRKSARSTPPCRRLR
jgi:methyl-accepting chemotaxis protein